MRLSVSLKLCLCSALLVLPFARLAAKTPKPNPKISLAQAGEIALKAVPGGKIKEQELEKEHGVWIYSFDIDTPSGIHEVWVDPQSGAVLKNEAESAAKEKAEAAQDRAAASSVRPASVVATVKIGGEGHWDYITLDSVAKRIYLPRSIHTQVLDLDGKLLGDIPDTNGVHGVALAQEFDRGFTSNGKDKGVTMFRLSTLAVEKKIPVTGEGPDAILYEPVTKQVFTFNGHGKNSTVLSAETGAVIGTIDLGGKPEFATTDGKGRIFLNIEDTSEVVAIDAKALKVVSRWPLAPLKEPSGMAIDAEHHRLFIVGDNNLMAVVDNQSGKVITTLPIGSGADGAAFDPGTGLAYSSNGEGNLTVVRQESPGHYVVAETIVTKRGARTIALDPRTHRLYLPTAEFGETPAPTAEQPHPRPTMLPGSFQLVVVGR